jgi:excisionase family DNA binding protein
MENIVTVKELANFLKLTEATVYKLVSSGELPGFKIGDSWRFNVEELMKLFRETETEQKQIPSDAKILEFPEFRQVFNYDCGASTLQAVLIYYGEDLREDRVLEVLGTNTAHGTPISDMIRGAAAFEIRYEERSNMTIEDLKKSIDESYPVIVDLQAWASDENINWKETWSEGHYVTVIGYDNENIYFEDPGDPKRTFLSFQELDDRWHDEEDDGTKYEHWGMICKGVPKFRMNALRHMD